MRSAICLLPVMLALGGCASVIYEPTQDIRIETRKDSGELVKGARCQLGNDRSRQTTSSGSMARVGRSAADLDIVCTHPAHATAVARATSRANAGMWGNVLLGGGVGAAIDHERGLGYSYPAWVQLVFGRALVFDRNDETAGRPTPAALPAQEQVTLAR